MHGSSPVRVESTSIRRAGDSVGAWSVMRLIGERARV